jgi:hypothetical protein
MMSLAMLHALHDRHEINLVAVTLSTEEKDAASYVDLVDTFYGHPSVAVGVVKNGVTGKATVERFSKQLNPDFFEAVPYPRALSQRRNPDGSVVYPHRLVDGSKAPEAVSLLRKTLASLPDGSAVMIQVGFCTNLARLVESAPDAASPLDGVALVRKKVKLLSLMGGNFAETHYQGKAYPKGLPEFNLMVDAPSAQKLFDRWPGDIVVSGVEIGGKLLYPAKSIEDDFTYAQNHPIAESYRYFRGGGMKWPHDHATFDLTSVLYAARPDRDYFSVSKPGKVTVMPDGSSKFEEIEGGRHRHLIMTDAQQGRALEALVMLTSQPPTR